MAHFPSSIPNGGRLLDRAEHDALGRDMEAIVLGSHLFKSLEETGRQELLESGVVLAFEAGDVVLSEGAEGDTMFLVMEGTLRVETRTPSGILQLAELRRGACVGEVSVLTGEPRTATVIAMTPVTMVMFARHRIARVLDLYPKVRALLEALVEGRARDTVDKLVSG